MAKRITVVVSQGQSHNPAKRKLEEDIVTNLLSERGVEVTVLPHLYDLAPDGTGILCLQGIAGDMVVLSWMYQRATRWILSRNGVLGQEGLTLLVNDDGDDDSDGDSNGETPEIDETERVIDSLAIPDRKIYCLDLRVSNDPAAYIDEIRRIASEATTATVELTSWLAGKPDPKHVQRLISPLPGNVDSHQQAGGQAEPAGNGESGSGQSSIGQSGNGQSGNGQSGNEQSGNGQSGNGQSPTPVSVVIDEETQRRWYPVIDFGRCTNCMECIDFCLFGVYGVDRADTILVEQPDNCRKGCPACSRVCPENAIIFPQHKTPAIAGSPEIVGSLKIDLSKLFGAPEAEAVDVAVLERDEQLMLAGRDTVGHSVGLPIRQPDSGKTEKDELDDLIDQLDEMDL